MTQRDIRGMMKCDYEVSVDIARVSGEIASSSPSRRLVTKGKARASKDDADVYYE
jgi:hypothetical protein